MNSFQLKIIALVLMTFDHIAYMLGSIIDVPDWFHLIGRLSAPIFLFMCANGYRYTHNKLLYMRRLYLWSVFMNFGNTIANAYFTHPKGAMVINGIFGTMFLIVYYLYAFEIISTNRKNWKKICEGICLLVLPIVLSVVMIVTMSRPEVFEIPYFNQIFTVITTLIPTPMLVEGGFLWILLGVGFYYCLKSKKALLIFYTIVSGFFFILAVQGGFTIEHLLIENNQWFMIFALPLLLSYNNKKGKGMKYFFYIYYPLHIYILLAIAHLLA